MNTKQEIWKDIEGYEGYYQVSNKGVVRSIDRLTKGSRNSMHFIKGKIMRSRIVAGYPRVGLTKQGIAVGFYVHRLVAAAFLGKPPKDYEVNHIDGIKTNNNLTNLEWVTRSYNHIHSVAIGARVYLRGSEIKWSKLTEKDVVYIKKSPLSNPALANKYHVNPSLISRIRNGWAWVHVKPNLIKGNTNLSFVDAGEGGDDIHVGDTCITPHNHKESK